MTNQKEVSASVLFPKYAKMHLPFASQGQLRAAAQLGREIESRKSGPHIVFLLREGIGGAGKSELLQAINPLFPEFGISPVPDDEKPSAFRQTHPVSNHLIATGRIFGLDQEGDVIIDVAGFTPLEIQKILGKSSSYQRRLEAISQYCMGSLRIAKVMESQLRYFDSTLETSFSYHSFLARITAQFLLDRIPEKFLGSDYNTYPELLENIFDQFVPEVNNEKVQLHIGLALYEMHQGDYMRIPAAFARLGTDPRGQEGKVNPVHIIREILSNNSRIPFRDEQKLYLPVKRIEEAMSVRAKNGEIGFPLNTYPDSLAAYQSISAGNIHEEDSVAREPRIYIVANVPKKLHTLLTECLTWCVNYPIQGNSRKVALAILDNQTNLSTYYIHGDRQFFQKSENGMENHSFFSEPFPGLREYVQGDKLNETLYYLAGDHSKVPIDPAMNFAIIVESILQQLGIMYAVRYVHREHLYDPVTRTLA